MPNTKNKRFEWADHEVLFRCQCKSDEFLEVYVWHDDPDEYQISFATMGTPVSLWGTLRAWWRRRNRYYQEIILDDADIAELLKVLQDYVQKNKGVSEEAQKDSSGS